MLVECFQGLNHISNMHARSTRLAGSVRDRAIAVNRDKSSSPNPQLQCSPWCCHDLEPRFRESPTRLPQGAAAKNPAQIESASQRRNPRPSALAYGDARSNERDGRMAVADERDMF